MKIRQRWYRRHQISSLSNNQSLLLRLFDASPVTSRLLELYNNNYSMPVLSQDWQKLEPDEAVALRNTHPTLIKQACFAVKET